MKSPEAKENEFVKAMVSGHILYSYGGDKMVHVIADVFMSYCTVGEGKKTPNKTKLYFLYAIFT